MKLNLEQTVQYLLNIVQSGIKPEKWLTLEQLTAYITDENVGKYYLVSRDGVDHLYYITRRDNGGLIADDLGQFPAKGAQGVPGEKGDAPSVSISNNNTWIIDGVDTGKPSRGKQGEKGNTGMQGVPGVGVSAMLSIDSTDYTPTVTDDGEYQDVESSADIRYSGDGEEHSTQVDFNIKVPKPDLSGTVEKNSATFADRDYKLYGITRSGAQTLVGAYGATGTYTFSIPNGVLPLFWNGTLSTNTPTQPFNCATKKYVDDNAQAKLYKHTGYFTDTDTSRNFYYAFISTKSTAYTLEELKTLTNVLFGTTYYNSGQNTEFLLVDFSYDNYSGTFSFTDVTGTETQVSGSDVTLAYDSANALS